MNLSFVKGNRIACIEVILLTETNWEYNIVVLKKNKTKLEFEAVKTSIDSFDEIKKTLSVKIPVCLVIYGKVIMLKKVSVKEDKEESILQKILPDATLNDFYFQELYTNNENKFVSVARKNLIEKILDTFSENKFHIVDITFGPFSIEHIFPLFDNVPDEILLEHYKLKIENSIIKDCKHIEHNKDEIKYQVGDEALSNKALVSFAGGFQYLFVNSGKTSTNIPAVIQSSKEYTNSRIFMVAGWGVLILTFSILLINFLLFDNYNKKSRELYSKVGQYESLLNKHDALEKELEIKKQLLEKTGLLQSSKMSFYADRLASTLPSEIKLTELNINPLKKKQQNKKELIFRKGIIHIAGTSKKSTVLNDWIKTIKQNDWAVDVTILGYKKDLANMPGKFTIEITVN